MRVAVAEPDESVRQASPDQRRERTADAAAGRGVHGASVSGLPEAGGSGEPRRLRGQHQTRAAVAAADGAVGNLPEAEPQQAASESSGLPVFAEESGDRGAEPGVGDGHHLHPAGARILLSGGGDRLAQSLRRGVETVGDDGVRLLHRRLA